MGLLERLQLRVWFIGRGVMGYLGQHYSEDSEKHTWRAQNKARPLTMKDTTWKPYLAQTGAEMRGPKPIERIAKAVETQLKKVKWDEGSNLIAIVVNC